MVPVVCYITINIVEINPIVPQDEDDSSTHAGTDEVNTSLKRQLDEELDDDTVTITPASKTSASESQDNGPPAKKITLNRKALSQAAPTTEETSEQEDKPKDDSEDKKVVKLSEISMKEVLPPLTWSSSYSFEDI